MSTSQTLRFQAMNQPVQGPIESRSTRGKDSWTSGPTTSPIFMCGRDLGAREGVSPFLTRSARGRVSQTFSDPSSATHMLLGKYLTFGAFLCVLLDSTWHTGEIQ